MTNPMPPGWRIRVRQSVRRVDRAAGDLNVVLAVFAIGLAVLDVTFLVTEQVVARLPEAPRAAYVDTAAAPLLPPNQRALP